MTTFKNGDRVISTANDWTKGLTGLIVADGALSMPPWTKGLTGLGDLSMQLVEFDPKDAKGRGQNEFVDDRELYRNNRWYLYHDELKPAQASTSLTVGTKGVAGDVGLPPQTRKVLAHLLEGKSITDLECSMVYRIKRLSDCIFKIRKAGYEVVTDIRKDEGGAKYARYRLASKAAA